MTERERRPRARAWVVLPVMAVAAATATCRGEPRPAPVAARVSGAATSPGVLADAARPTATAAPSASVADHDDKGAPASTETNHAAEFALALGGDGVFYAAHASEGVQLYAFRSGHFELDTPPGWSEREGTLDLQRVDAGVLAVLRYWHGSSFDPMFRTAWPDYAHAAMLRGREGWRGITAGRNPEITYASDGRDVVRLDVAPLPDGKFGCAARPPDLSVYCPLYMERQKGREWVALPRTTIEEAQGVRTPLRARSGLDGQIVVFAEGSHESSVVWNGRTWTHPLDAPTAWRAFSSVGLLQRHGPSVKAGALVPASLERWDASHERWDRLGLDIEPRRVLEAALNPPTLITVDVAGGAPEAVHVLVRKGTEWKDAFEPLRLREQSGSALRAVKATWDHGVPVVLVGGEATPPSPRNAPTLQLWRGDPQGWKLLGASAAATPP